MLRQRIPLDARNCQPQYKAKLKISADQLIFRRLLLYFSSVTLSFSVKESMRVTKLQACIEAMCGSSGQETVLPFEVSFLHQTKKWGNMSAPNFCIIPERANVSTSIKCPDFILLRVICRYRCIQRGFT